MNKGLAWWSRCLPSPLSLFVAAVSGESVQSYSHGQVRSLQVRSQLSGHAFFAIFREWDNGEYVKAALCFFHK